VTTKFLDIGRGSTGHPTIGREPISEDRSTYRGVEGGSKELNIPAKPEQRKKQKRIHLVYHF
jgi:hypothetical protein